MITKVEHDTLVNKIFTYDYYVHIFQKLDKEYTSNRKDCRTPEFWNDFWSALPDSPAIRREPFFDVCDLAERIYSED